MKQYLILALLAAGTEAGYAQSIAAGTISLGGSIGYSRTNNKNSSVYNGTTYTAETTSSQFSFMPTFGYFVTNNLALGLSLGYTVVNPGYPTFTPSPGIVRAKPDPNTTFQIGPFAQYYKMISAQFGVTGTLSTGYQNRRISEYFNNNINNGVIEYKGSGYYAALTPGIVFFPIPKFGLSASLGSLGYSRNSYDFPTGGGPAPDGYKNTASTFNASFGLDRLQLGGTYYFGR